MFNPEPTLKGSNSPRRKRTRSASSVPGSNAPLAPVPFPLLFHFDIQPFDFLIEGGERNLEPFGGLGLASVGAPEHLADDARQDYPAAPGLAPDLWSIVFVT